MSFILYANSTIGTTVVAASWTFVTSSVEHHTDIVVGEASVSLEFTGVVVSLIVGAAERIVGLGTVCITDAHGFCLIL